MARNHHMSSEWGEKSAVGRSGQTTDCPGVHERHILQVSPHAAAIGFGWPNSGVLPMSRLWNQLNYWGTERLQKLYRDAWPCSRRTLTPPND